jgi:uroporphyrinogen-III synthase
LRHPRLASVSGSRILIVKGRGGRALLESDLTRRGARVTIADVYLRACPAVAPDELAALELRFKRGEIQVVTATSVEIGANLLKLATVALRAHFEAAHWLVPGARVAEELRERGLAAPLLAAASADDQDLVSALVRWRSSVSGA